MNFEQVKNAVSIAEVFTHFGHKVNRGGYVCCPFHAENTPSCKLYPETKTFKCFVCRAGGDIFDFIQEVEHLDRDGALRWIKETFHLEAGSGPAPQVKPKASRIKQRGPKPIDPAAVRFWTDYADRMHEMINQPQGKVGLDYFTLRGISQEIIDRFRLGYDPQIRRAIVPGDNGFCIRRDITEKHQHRYKNPSRGGDAECPGLALDLFNGAALYQAEKPVFIVEGAINALSIIQAGGQAVALNSTSNVHILKAKERPKAELIIWMNDDQAGHKAAAELKSLFTLWQIPYTEKKP